MIDQFYKHLELLYGQDIQSLFANNYLPFRYERESFHRNIHHLGENVSNELAGKITTSKLEYDKLKQKEAAPLARETATSAITNITNILTHYHSVSIVGNGINQGTTAPDIHIGHFFHIENDDSNKSIEAKTLEWQEFGLPQPSFQVFTGSKSVHHYYVLDSSIPMERLYEIKAQFVRKSGMDGFQLKTLASGLNPFKAQTYRMAGTKHSKTQKLAEIISTYRNYSVDELEAVAQSINLGDWNHEKEGIETNAIFPSKQILDPSWRDRFLPYLNLEDSAKAVEEAYAAKKLAASLAGTAAFERKISFSNPTQKASQQLTVDADYKLDITKCLYVAVRPELITGSKDGTGRSHTRAFAIAKNLREVENCALGLGLQVLESAENIYEQWILKTFDLENRDDAQLVSKVWHCFNSFANTGWTEEQESYIVNHVIGYSYDNQVSLDEYFHKINALQLTDNALRDRIVSVDESTLLDMTALPVFFDSAKISIFDIYEEIETKKRIKITADITLVQSAIADGSWTIYASKDSLVHLDILSKFVVEMDVNYQLPIVGKISDKILATTLRAGIKLNPNSQTKAPQPIVTVVDKSGIKYGAHHYWHLQSEIIDTTKMDGFTWSNQWFSETIEMCDLAMRSRLLTASKSEMGTGKTQAFGSVFQEKWGRKLLSVSHRTNLCEISSKRLGLVFYKTDKKNSPNQAATYELAKQRGLAVTINTLVKGDKENSGYLSDFNIVDWKDSTLLIDEVESFVHFLTEASILKNIRQDCINTLIEAIRTVVIGGGNIHIADANLKKSTVILFEKFVADALKVDWLPDQNNQKYNCFTVINTFKKLEGRQLFLVDKKDALVTAVAENDGKIAYFTDVKTASKKNIQGTQGLTSFIKSIGGNAHVIDANSQRHTDDADHKVLHNLHNNIHTSLSYTLVCSPQIDSGVSWENLGVNAIYASYSGVMGLGGTLQQLERVRDNVPRFLYAQNRARTVMSAGDILNIESTIESNIQSYSSQFQALSNNWVNYSLMLDEEIQQRIGKMFPTMSSHLMEWWKNHMFGEFYGNQEFKINLIASMQNRGYVVNTSDLKANVKLIDDLKEHCDFLKEQNVLEVSQSDPNIKVENEDRVTKTEAQSLQLTGMLAGISLTGENYEKHLDNSEKIELVKQSMSGKLTKRSLTIGLCLRAMIANDSSQFELANLIRSAVDFKSMATSESKASKDIAPALLPAIEMLQTCNVANVIRHLLVEGFQNGFGENAMYINNENHLVRTLNQHLLEYSLTIKKYFGIVLRQGREFCAANVVALLKALGFIVSQKKRHRKDGKNIHYFVMKDCQMRTKIYRCWFLQWQSKDESLLRSFYNPHGDVNVDPIWKAKAGIHDPYAMFNRGNSQLVTI